MGKELDTTESLSLSLFKKDRKILVHFQDKPFNITVIQVYAPPTDAEKAEVDQFYEDIEDLELQ